MAYLDLVIDGFNKALLENKDDIDAIQKLLEANHAYLIAPSIITDLFYRQANVQDMALAVNQLLIGTSGKYMQQEHAAELGEGLFYLLKLYVTVTAMMTTYANRLHTKYNFSAKVIPVIDIKKLLEIGQYSNVILRFWLDQPIKEVALHVVFREADYTNLISSDTFIDRLKNLDVRVDSNAIYIRGSDKISNIDTIKLSDFAKWLNSTLTPELIKGI